MKIGTKSVLYGAHCFLLHPWFVAMAWWRLYGFPWDPRLWVAFFVHDLGYIGKPNMDGPEGETHPELGAKIMRLLFDRKSYTTETTRVECRYIYGVGYSFREVMAMEATGWTFGGHVSRERQIGIYEQAEMYRLRYRWHDFALLHSRYLAKKLNLPCSRLCVADKLAIALTPWWLYLPMVTATGEIHEYLKNAQRSESGHWRPTGFDARLWFRQLGEYMRKWVDEHKDGAPDTWTTADRHAEVVKG